MKAKEFEIKKRDPNWRAMQDIRRSGAGGQHKDKKRAAKQGEVKHKGRMAEDADELYGLRIGDTVIAKINGQRVQGNIIDIYPEDMEVELMLRGPEAGRTVTVDVRDTEIIEDRSVSEGDEPDEQYLDKVISDLHKDAFGMRPDHEFGREWMSSSYEEKLRIFKNMLKNLHSDIGEVMAYGTGFGSSSQSASPRRKNSSMLSIMQRMKDKEKKKTPEVGDRIEFGQFNKPDSMKKATVVKVGNGGLVLTIKTDDGKQGNISLGNKSLALKILEDDGTITQNLPFGSVRLPKPDPVTSRPGLQQRPEGEKEKESMPPKIKRLWDRIKQEPKIWAEVMNIIDEFDTLRDDEIEDEINAFLSSDTLIMRAVGIVLQYEHEKMKNESVHEDSDWGEPREILEDVLRTLEREVEWPLTEVMDPKEVRQLLAPIIKAVNDKMMSMEEGRRDYGYDSFGNSLRPGDDEGSTEPPNNFAIYINGKKWKVFKGQGHYADDEYEMQQFRRLQQMAARKSQETGKKWEVSRTSEPATK